jgi:hypothetical protein
VLDLPAKDRPALRKLDSGRTPKKTTRKKTRRAKAKAIMYSSKPPTGLMPVGTMVTYRGGARLRNDWLRKGMTGRVFGYRPGKTGGGLYAIRFEKGVTLFSAKRVERPAAPRRATRKSTPSRRVDGGT